MELASLTNIDCPTGKYYCVKGILWLELLDSIIAVFYIKVVVFIYLTRSMPSKAGFCKVGQVRARPAVFED